jgi:hypothetical protein
MRALFWYNGGEFGEPAYAAGSYNSTTLSTSSAPVQTLSFSNWDPSYAAVGGLGLAASMTNTGDACANDVTNDEFCGTFISLCMAQLDMPVATTSPQNAMQVVVLSGDATSLGTADGRITFTKQLFDNTKSSCLSPEVTLTVDAVGFYSTLDMPANPLYPINTGYRQINVQYPTLTVTPSNQQYVDYLVANCACGDATLWQLNTARTLTYCGQVGMTGRPCEALFAAGIFPGGSISTPGFGVIQLANDQLRISPLVTDMSEGTSQLMTMETTFSNRAINCISDQTSASLCGQYDFPCHSIAVPQSSSQAAYASSGVFAATGPGEACSECFYMNTTYFTAENGCEANSPNQYIQVEQNGHYGIQGPASSTIKGGNKVQFTMQMYVVTPLSDAAVQELQLLCACSSLNGTWAKGSARSFDQACPESECSLTLFRQIVGGGLQFGVFKHTDTNLRFTMFTNSSVTGWDQAAMTMDDYQYVLISGTCSPDLPSYPVGPNPHPSPATGKHGGTKTMGGGDVFILLLFLTIIVYFGGGMAYHFQRTGGFKNGGTPVIPHVSFWRSIPVLVAEGCHFSITERCGTRKVGPAYSTFGAAPTDSDFGNTTGGATSKNGYGAL